MCGRYTLTKVGPELKKRFKLSSAELKALKEELRARFNIGPGQHLPIITKDDKGRHIELMRWGYMPHWAKDFKIGYRFINAKSETVFEKPTWKNAILNR